MSKILVIGNTAESLVNFRRSFLLELVVNGHQVVACTPASDPQTLEKISSMGIEFRPVKIERTGLNPIKDFIYIFSLLNVILQVKPDCVFTYTIKPNIYGILLARLCGIKNKFALITGLGYAFTIGGGFKRNIIRVLVKFFYRLSFSNVNGVIFQNSDDRDLFIKEKLLGSDVPGHTVNGSGVDLSEFTYSPSPEGNIVFLLIARMLRDKGIVEYCEAATIVKIRYPDVRFLLVGPIDPNPSAVPFSFIQKFVDQNILEYQSFVKDVRPLLQQCTIFVLPSYREGTPRSVLEAMATGRATITTNAPGCRETVINGKNGIIVAVADVHALSSAMVHMINNPDSVKAMGIAGRNIAEEKYDSRMVSAQMIRLMNLT